MSSTNTIPIGINNPKPVFDDVRRPKRGMVVWFKPGVCQRLRPTDKENRAWFIVQADWIQENPNCSTLIVAPITSWKFGDARRSGSRNVYIVPPFIKVPSFVQCGDLQTVEILEVERCWPEAGKNPKVPKPVLEDIAYALGCVLGLE